MSIFEADVLRSSNSTGHPPTVAEFTSATQQPGLDVFAMVTLSRCEVTAVGGSAAAGIDWYERFDDNGQIHREQPEFWVRSSCLFIRNLHRVHFILVTVNAKGVAVASLSAV